MHKKEDMVIRCLNCGIKNRIPKDRLQERPTCGRCHALLDDILIRCLNCGTKNRMPEDRLNGEPKCGKCGSPLVGKEDAVHPVDITDASFSSEILLFPGSVLVDCWAPWCAPCRAVAPVLDELASKYAGDVKIAKLNIDENPITASQYSVQSIPTMLFFREGKLVNRLVGAFPKGVIERNLLDIIKTN